MMQNQKYILLRPICFILSATLAFAFSLTGYIITAIHSYYDDGYGLSISYGSKGLLFTSIISFLVMIFGIFLLVNVLSKKKENDHLQSIFMGVLLAITFFFFLSYIIKPIIENEVEFNLTYIMMIVSAAISLIGLPFAIILAIETYKQKTSYNSIIYSYIISICFALSLGLYGIAKGIEMSSDIVGIFCYLFAIAHVFEIVPSILGIHDTRLR